VNVLAPLSPHSPPLSPHARGGSSTGDDAALQRGQRSHRPTRFASTSSAGSPGAIVAQSRHAPAAAAGPALDAPRLSSQTSPRLAVRCALAEWRCSGVPLTGNSDVAGPTPRFGYRV
jgi:hypothetical protein